MIGTGVGFILHDVGWSCSNQVAWDVEMDLMVVEGKKISKRTQKLKFNCTFDGVGNLTEGISVYCLYKDDEKGEEVAFSGTISAITKTVVFVTVQPNKDKLTEIKNKIHSW